MFSRSIVPVFKKNDFREECCMRIELRNEEEKKWCKKKQDLAESDNLFHDKISIESPCTVCSDIILVSNYRVIA